MPVVSMGVSPTSIRQQVALWPGVSITRQCILTSTHRTDSSADGRSLAHGTALVTE